MVSLAREEVATSRGAGSGNRVVMLVAVATSLTSALSAAILIEGKKSEGSMEQLIAEEEAGSNPLEP